MDQAQQQTSPMPEQRDVSRQTMVVLVILAIVVSLLGTFTVLRETTGANKIVYRNQMNEQPSQAAQGMISLTIVDSNGQKADSATGRVTFRIER